MSTTVFTILLYFSMLFNPGAITFDRPATVEAGVAVLNEQYPDWVEHYEDDEFDCSEMSALVSQYFITAGYTDVQVKSGYNKDIGGHSWVVVNGNIIEATGLYVSDDIEFYNSFTDRGRQMYNDIDWWNSEYMLDNGLRGYIE